MTAGTSSELSGGALRAPLPVTAALGHAAAEPGAVAVVDGATGERLTRGELAARSAGVARELERRGVRRGDIVALAMPNGAAWPLLALGAWRAGAAVTAMSALWTKGEAGRALEMVTPRLVLASETLAPVVRAAGHGAGRAVDVVVPDADLLGAEDDDPYREPDLERGDLAVVPFSSGSGGLPKGVRLSHGALAAASYQGIDVLSAAGELDQQSVSLAGAPFFHSMGLILALCAPLTAGACIVTVPAPRLAAVPPLVAAHRVTHMTVPPPLVEALAYHPSVDEHDLSSLVLVATGGAHVPPRWQLDAGARLGCVVRQGYGLTEASCTISAPRRGRPSDPETVGRLVDDVEARLVDPETGRDVEGEGELWVRGPQLMDGYHGLPEATAAVLMPDGWLRTGDLVAMRDDGQLEIRDRLKEVIKVGGSSVAPAELELVLREHPAVRDAGVVGRPDPRLGQVPVALAVLREPAEPDDLAAFVAERVAGYKRLRDVVVVDEIPRQPTGKLVRGRLAEQARAMAKTA